MVSQPAPELPLPWLCVNVVAMVGLKSDQPGRLGPTLKKPTTVRPPVLLWAQTSLPQARSAWCLLSRSKEVLREGAGVPVMWG